MGPRNLSKSQINRELAPWERFSNSAGGYDFSVLAMQCVGQQFERSWQLLSDVVLNPLFDEKETELNRVSLLLC
jgi:predicted Zn-dependent peptidase